MPRSRFTHVHIVLPILSHCVFHFGLTMESQSIHLKRVEHSVFGNLCAHIHRQFVLACLASEYPHPALAIPQIEPSVCEFAFAVVAAADRSASSGIFNSHLLAIIYRDLSERMQSIQLNKRPSSIWIWLFLLLIRCMRKWIMNSIAIYFTLARPAHLWSSFFCQRFCMRITKASLIFTRWMVLHS